jgi:histidine triad (HIT) family protein
MADCIFCKIVQGEIPAGKVYEDDLVLAFKDINPAAPTHVLIIPKEHIPSINEVTPAQQELMGHILVVAARIAREAGLVGAGCRIVNNCGADGGQTVFHLHFHLLGGRSLQWPPG